MQTLTMIFLQQKMKVASSADRFKIVTAISNRGFEMMVRIFTLCEIRFEVHPILRTFTFRHIVSETVRLFPSSERTYADA